MTAIAAGRSIKPRDAPHLEDGVPTRSARLTAIVDHLPVILAEVNCDGVFTLCEGDGLRLLNKRPREVIGHTIDQLYPDRTDLLDNHQRALTGAAFSASLELGGRIWRTTYQPTHNARGRVSGFTSVMLDVTEAAQAEAARQASDKHLHLVTQSVPIVLFSVDGHGAFTLADGKGFADVGLDPKQVVGSTLEEFLPEVAPALAVHHQRALAGDEFAATVEVGHRIWDMRYVPTRDTGGRVVGFCAVGLDVTERVRSETDLEAIRRRDAGVAELSRFALAGAPVLDLMQAAAHLIAHELTGVDYAAVGEMTPEGLRRLAAFGVADPEGAVMLTPEPSAYSAMRSIQLGQSIIVPDWEHETRFAQPDWLRVEGVKSSAFLPVVSQPKDRVFGFLGAHSKRRRSFSGDELAFLETVANLLGDAISVRQAQEAAAEEAERFRALAENSPDIVARFDRNLRMVYVNGAIERVTGTPAEVLIGRTLGEATMPEPQRSAFELGLRQVLRSGLQRAVDFDIQTVRGPRTFQSRLAPEFGPDGGVQSVVVAARDITARQRVAHERLVLYGHLSEARKERRELQQERSELLARLVDRHRQDIERIGTDAQLTERQRQILRLIARGCTNREIALELHVSHGTVKNDVTRILQKLDLTDRAQAAAEAVRLGVADAELVPPSPAATESCSPTI